MKYQLSKLMIAAALGLSAPYASAMGDMDMADANASKQQVQKASGKGTVVSVDVSKGTIRLKHDPIPALGWPTMNMQFSVADKASLKGLNKTDWVEFTLKAAGDEYVITDIKPMAPSSSPRSR
jgi:Cu(I)/Ag(I) efflux system protein CusF